MEEVYSMSDKMLMEGWRKFLTEEDTNSAESKYYGDWVNKIPSLQTQLFNEKLKMRFEADRLGERPGGRKRDRQLSDEGRAKRTEYDASRLKQIGDFRKSSGQIIVDLGFEYLGAGSFREVFRPKNNNDFIIKLIKEKQHVGMNQVEGELQTGLRGLFPRVYKHGAGAFGTKWDWIVVESVTPLNSGEELMKHLPVLAKWAEELIKGLEPKAPEYPNWENRLSRDPEHVKERETYRKIMKELPKKQRDWRYNFRDFDHSTFFKAIIGFFKEGFLKTRRHVQGPVEAPVYIGSETDSDFDKPVIRKRVGEPGRDAGGTNPYYKGPFEQLRKILKLDKYAWDVRDEEIINAYIDKLQVIGEKEPILKQLGILSNKYKMDYADFKPQNFGVTKDGRLVLIDASIGLFN